MFGTRVYEIYRGMISRCENPNVRCFGRYGGRGIKVCKRWRRSFPAFLRDVGEPPTRRHTLDRIDVERNYDPSNCRWLLPKEQARNRRANALITIGGETRCLADWLAHLKMYESTYWSRRRRGWSPQEALTRVIPPGQDRAAKPTVSRTHGLSKTKAYRAWQHMKRRCLDPDSPGYANYGARGITVCERWLASVADFVADVGPPPSPRHYLDRIDPNGNYEPSNCRWASPAESALNTRANRLITIDGRTQPLTLWLRETQIERGAFYARIYRGWNLEDALLTPTDRAQGLSDAERRMRRVLAKQRHYARRSGNVSV